MNLTSLTRTGANIQTFLSNMKNVSSFKAPNHPGGFNKDVINDNKLNQNNTNSFTYTVLVLY